MAQAGEDLFSSFNFCCVERCVRAVLYNPRTNHWRGMISRPNPLTGAQTSFHLNEAWVYTGHSATVAYINCDDSSSTTTILTSNRTVVELLDSKVLSAVLYGYETWSLALKEEHGSRLWVFENRVLRRMFGPERDEVTGERRKLCGEKLDSFFFMKYY
jgi:hypothetical protein